ncbi:hypothetical protein [Streptomyces sp. T028]|uniref:hypothetical protein n=1 Tax=Streptomyces sp. T028 TaxID=3394379 RepID=UPI003A8B852E
MSTARMLDAALPLLWLLAVLVLVAHAACRWTARRLARYLRAYADQMQSYNPLRSEPPGIRHAADLIDPRARRRYR